MTTSTTRLALSERAANDELRLTAARIFKTNPETVTPAQRRYAKAVNYARVYNVGPATFSAMLRAAQKTA